jgi:hypothetical protein
MTPEPDDALWLTKRDAATFLGVSTKQVERREAAGQLRKRTLPRAPGETSARVVYSRADLLALKAGAPNEYGTPLAAIMQGAPAQTARVSQNETHALATSRVDSFAAALFAHFEAGRLSAAPSVVRPWLTLDEAAAWSGLSRGYLLRRAREGAPFALDQSDGGTRAAWRFSRAGLEGAGK